MDTQGHRRPARQRKSEGLPSLPSIHFIESWQTSQSNHNLSLLLNSGNLQFYCMSVIMSVDFLLGIVYLIWACCPISQAASSLIATLPCLFGSPVYLFYCFTGDGQLEPVCLCCKWWRLGIPGTIRQFGNPLRCGAERNWNMLNHHLPELVELTQKKHCHLGLSLYPFITSCWPGDTVSHLREFLLRGCQCLKALKALIVLACCKFVFQSAVGPVGFKADPVLGRSLSQ